MACPPPTYARGVSLSLTVRWGGRGNRPTYHARRPPHPLVNLQRWRDPALAARPGLSLPWEYHSIQACRLVRSSPRLVPRCRCARRDGVKLPEACLPRHLALRPTLPPMPCHIRPRPPLPHPPRGARFRDRTTCTHARPQGPHVPTYYLQRARRYWGRLPSRSRPRPTSSHRTKCSPHQHPLRWPRPLSGTWPRSRSLWLRIAGRLESLDQPPGTSN